MSKIPKWLPVILWIAVIFLFSAQPDLPSNKIYWLDFIFKKSAHLTEFGILLFLTFRALNYQLLNYSILFSLLYAFSDEIHQLFVPGRSGQLTDVLIDLTGIIIATWVIIHFKLWKSKAIRQLILKK